MHTHATKPPFPLGSPAYYAAFHERWMNVFIITAEVYMFGIIIYVLFGSGTEQDWASGGLKAKDLEANGEYFQENGSNNMQMTAESLHE